MVPLPRPSPSFPPTRAVHQDEKSKALAPLGDLCKTYRHSRVGGNPQGRVCGATTSQHQPTDRPVILDCTRHSRVGGNLGGGARRPVILASRQYP